MLSTETAHSGSNNNHTEAAATAMDTDDTKSQAEDEQEVTMNGNANSIEHLKSKLKCNGSNVVSSDAADSSDIDCPATDGLITTDHPPIKKCKLNHCEETENHHNHEDHDGYDDHGGGDLINDHHVINGSPESLRRKRMDKLRQLKQLKIELNNEDAKLILLKRLYYSQKAVQQQNRAPGAAVPGVVNRSQPASQQQRNQINNNNQQQTQPRLNQNNINNLRKVSSAVNLKYSINTYCVCVF